MKKSGTAIFFIALFVVFIFLLVPRLIQVEALKDRSRNLDREIQKRRAENTELENELRLLRDDPVYLEKVAREKFNKAKEGEIVYKVVREGEKK